jgi:hypothetical protein
LENNLNRLQIISRDSRNDWQRIMCLNLHAKLGVIFGAEDQVY